MCQSYNTEKLNWTTLAGLLICVASLTACRRSEWHASSSASLSVVASPSATRTRSDIPTEQGAVSVATVDAKGDDHSLPVRIARYSVQYTDFYFVHVFLLRNALAIAITSVAKGPVRILVSTANGCSEMPHTNDQLPTTGNVDLNQDRQIFGWKKPPCCGDMPGRLGKEVLLHLASREEEGGAVAYFLKYEPYSPGVTAEVFTFGHGNWTRSPLGRKPHQIIASVFEDEKAVWLIEILQDQMGLLEIREDHIASRKPAERLAAKFGQAQSRGLDLQVFTNGLGLSWGYLRDRRLIVDRWGSKTTKGKVTVVENVLLPEPVLEEFAQNRTRHGVEHPGLDFEYKSSEQFILVRRGEPRMRITYDEAKQAWTSAEEAESTTQEKVASLLNLNLEPKGDSDSVKVSGNRWVAVRRKDAEHVIEVFTNDDSLARCGTITDEPYVYSPSNSFRESRDSGH